jgi:hypothetical protein
METAYKGHIFRFPWVLFIYRRVWRYQWGNQDPYIEEEQTTQWPKEKVQKDKQQSTKHTVLRSTSKDWLNQNQDNVVGLHVYPRDSISGIVVSMFSLSVVDREFEPHSGKTKDHKHWYVLLLH